MFQIFWEFAASQNKNEINDNKQVNWESVIFQVMGTSTCYLSSNHLFFLYSLQGHFSNRWRDKQFNMTLPFQRFFHFLSFCLCFCLCLSLYLSLVSPLSFLSWYIPVFLQREVSVMILHFRHLESALVDTNTILSSHSVSHIHMCERIWVMLLL